MTLFKEVRPPHVAGFASARKGFTLIELLVTMMVIMIISGFVMTAVGGNDGTNELNSAISRADSVFSLARSAAISRKTPVRVMVSYDSTRGGRDGEYLRYLVVYYLDREDAGGARWKPFAEAEYLPQGIFVDASSMTANGGEFRVWSPPVGAAQIIQDYVEIPEPAAASLPDLATNGSPGGDQWIVYDFHANGTARHPMTRFIVGRALEPQVPLQVIPNEFMRAGFVLFRSGKVVHFQSSEHLRGAIN